MVQKGLKLPTIRRRWAALKNLQLDEIKLEYSQTIKGLFNAMDDTGRKGKDPLVYDMLRKALDPLVPPQSLLQLAYLLCAFHGAFRSRSELKELQWKNDVHALRRQLPPGPHQDAGPPDTQHQA
jgi:hypothetical protein